MWRALLLRRPSHPQRFERDGHSTAELLVCERHPDALRVETIEPRTETRVILGQELAAGLDDDAGTDELEDGTAPVKPARPPLLFGILEGEHLGQEGGLTIHGLPPM